jgi:hypothetical protein
VERHRQALEQGHEEAPAVRRRSRPLAERRNWQAARLPQPDNAEARRLGAAVEEAADVVGPVRVRHLRTQAT